MNIITITPDNADKESLYCLKNPKHKGFQAKKRWLADRLKEGYQMRVLKDENGKPAAMIEYVPSEYAWRPIIAENYMFIQCLIIIYKEHTGKGYAEALIKDCIDEAKSLGMDGVVTLCSEGTWIASKQIFLKHGFELKEQLERFELLSLKFKKDTDDPKIFDYTESRKSLTGWQLHYANQCALFDTTIKPLQDEAKKVGIDLEVIEYTSASQAQTAPSGFGVFTLVKDGKLLADNYISKGRFKNILKAEGVK